MTDINLRHTALHAALEACAELVALCRRVDGIEHLAEQATEDTVGNLGAIFVPVGFHHAGFGRFNVDHKAHFLPEIFHHRPYLRRIAFHHQPALRAGTLHARLALFRQYTRTGAACGDTALLAPFFIQRVIRKRCRALARIRNGIAIIRRGTRQIRRHFQRRQFAR